ncbi:hypothetical protein ACLOJK_011951 [Asimina triloba]
MLSDQRHGGHQSRRHGSHQHINSGDIEAISVGFNPKPDPESDRWYKNQWRADRRRRPDRQRQEPIPQTIGRCHLINVYGQIAIIHNPNATVSQGANLGINGVGSTMSLPILT